MLKVYIASPYTLGDPLTNVNRQIAIAEELRSKDDRILPFWPLQSHYWDQLYQHDYDFWMKLCIDWLSTMDVLLRLLGESKGADKEVKIAKQLGIPVFYSVDKILDYCEEYHA